MYPTKTVYIYSACTRVWVWYPGIPEYLPAQSTPSKHFGSACLTPYINKNKIIKIEKKCKKEQRRPKRRRKREEKKRKPTKEEQKRRRRGGRSKKRKNKKNKKKQILVYTYNRWQKLRLVYDRYQQPVNTDHVVHVPTPYEVCTYITYILQGQLSTSTYTLVVYNTIQSTKNNNRRKEALSNDE